jgi:hypothetical protein
MSACLPGARACAVCPGVRPTQPLVPPPISAPRLCAQCPPGKVLCNRLKLIVLWTTPWSKPLVQPQAASSAINCPPAAGLVSRGLVRPASVCGSAGAVRIAEVPAPIKARWPRASARVLQYDFHATDSNAVATVDATTGACTSATLEFCYSWCGDALACDGSLLPRFKVLRATHEGISFSVVDDTTYVSTNPCEESWVVLQLQQDCSPCGVDVFTVDGSATCSARASLCGPEGITYTRTIDADTGITSYIQTS